MRILWLCNIVLPLFAEDIGIAPSAFGGWLSGTLKAIHKEPTIKLGVCFPLYQAGEIVHGVVDEVEYFGFPASKKTIIAYDMKIECDLIRIIKKFKPELVHIWGTEFPHALAMTRAFGNTDKTIVSIQGLCGECAEHYYAHMEYAQTKNVTLRDFIRRDSIQKQKEKYNLRGKMERQALANVGHIIGRTRFDRACTQQHAPDAVYHVCNEILRDVFYLNRATWSVEACEAHTIFVSQASYPIKGFHMVLKALPEIIKKYPDANVITTGEDPRKIPFYRINGYQQYISKLILRNKLDNCVHFVGTLNEEAMCKRYLKSNVFVSASSIENSPNSVGEAMLLGVPIVASYVGGTMDLLADQTEGYLYQADAPYMLAYYICEVFEHPNKSTEMGRRASEHAEKTHNPEKNAQQLLHIYREVFN